MENKAGYAIRKLTVGNEEGPHFLEALLSK